MKLSFAAFVICCLLLAGCGDKSAPDSGRETVDWNAVLKDWKSADGPARLTMIRQPPEFENLVALEKHLFGKTDKELKDVLGEPDAVEGRRFLHESKGTYVYFLGSTTKATPYKQQEMLYCEFDKEGKVGDVTVQFNRSGK